MCPLPCPHVLQWWHSRGVPRAPGAGMVVAEEGSWLRVQ